MPQAAAALPIISGIASAVSAISTVSNAFGGKPKAAASPAPAPIPAPAVAPDFKPVKPVAKTLPTSLSDMSGFSPDQQRSALATKGTQTGLGADEDQYYKNLVQRSLIGDDNSVTGSTNSLLPVESQYLSQGGVNTSDIMTLLRQIQGGTS